MPSVGCNRRRHHRRGPRRDRRANHSRHKPSRPLRQWMALSALDARWMSACLVPRRRHRAERWPTSVRLGASSTNVTLDMAADLWLPSKVLP